MKVGIKDIALSGAPCSGKSTAISSIVEFVNSLGIMAVSVPEAATELKINGIVPGNYENPDMFQDFLIERLLSNESLFGRALRHSKGVSEHGGVKICDRGLTDCLAYSSEESLEVSLAKHQLNLKQEIASRYDKVILMEIAPEKYYTTENNAAREESYPEALELNKKIKTAWAGHHDLVLIGNDYGSFDGKVNAVIQNIAQILGVPKPLAIERKWLVQDMNHMSNFALEHFFEDKEAVRVNIVQHYLARSNEERVRAWTRDGVTMYFHTEKSNEPSMERVKTEEIISRQDYERLLKKADLRCAPIEKVRHYFIDNNQYFRLDTFHHESAGHLLEVQPTVMQEEIVLPDCLNILREVTDEPEYYNYNIAKQLAQHRRCVK